MFSGIGLICTHGAFSAIVPLYFEDLQYFVLGAQGFGTAVGMMITPFSMKALLDMYGYTGASICTAAICLQICVCGALLRPAWKPNENIKDHSEQCATLENNIRPISYISMEHKDGKTNHGFAIARLSTSSESCTNKTPDSTNTHKDSDAAPATACRFPTLAMLGNLTFVHSAFGILSCSIVLSTFDTLLYSLAMERGIPHDDTLQFLTYVAIADLICRPSIGTMIDIPRLKPFAGYIYALFIIISGLSNALLWFATSLPWFIILGSIYQAVKGTLMAQIPGLMIHLFGMERLLPSLGMSFVFVGVGMLIGPFLAGKLYVYLGFQN